MHDVAFRPVSLRSTIQSPLGMLRVRVGWVSVFEYGFFVEV
jgi:hypothetical protein